MFDLTIVLIRKRNSWMLVRLLCLSCVWNDLSKLVLNPNHVHLRSTNRHAAKKEDTREKQLLLAGKAGTARELFEETGIDVRSHLERLVPAILRIDAKIDKEGTSVLANEHKHRLFYFLLVTDEDFAKKGVGAMGTDKADCKYRHVKVGLPQRTGDVEIRQTALTLSRIT
jgi:hypothetical protein